MPRENLRYENAEKYKPAFPPLRHLQFLLYRSFIYSAARHHAIIIFAKSERSRFHFNFLIAFRVRNRKDTANFPFQQFGKNGGCCRRWPRVPLMDNSSRASLPLLFTSIFSCVVFFYYPESPKIEQPISTSFSPPPWF